MRSISTSLTSASHTRNLMRRKARTNQRRSSGVSCICHRGLMRTWPLNESSDGIGRERDGTCT